MSRSRHLEIELPGGIVRFNITLNKSFGEKTNFKMTWVDPESKEVRTVNTVRVVSKEQGLKPTDLSDIKKILKWTEPSSSYEYTNDEGQKSFLPIDTNVLNKIFTSNNKLRVQAFIPLNEFSFADLAGDHYYLTPRVDSKTKSAQTNDLQGYALTHWILKNRKQVIECKFISGDREKVGVIYARGDVLMLSTVIHSTYQRNVPDNAGLDKLKEVELRNPEGLADKLLSKFSKPTRDPELSCDVYEEQLNSYIEDLKARERLRKEGKLGLIPIKPIKPIRPQHNEDDLFSMLEKL